MWRGRKKLDIGGECGESGETQFVGLLEKSRSQYIYRVLDRFVKKKGETGTDKSTKEDEVEWMASQAIHGQYLSKSDEQDVSC